MAVTSTSATGNVGLATALANQAQAQANVSSSSSSSGSATTLNANFDTFLTLLTTQLKNQNPLDPLNTDQFTQQITQFSGVEQQLKTNDLLQQLITNQTASTTNSALSFLGNDVVAKAGAAQLANGQAQWTLNAPSDASATITITNAAGTVVRTETRALKTGSNSYTWNGRNDGGVQQPDGAYTISIQATAADGTSQTISSQASGRVTSVDLSGSEPILTVNGTQVKLSDILSVSTPGA